MSPRGGGFLDAARQILEEAGQPLHGLEIIKRARERGMFTSQAKSDWSLVRTIYSDITRGGNRRHMTNLGKNYYGLEDWASAHMTHTSTGEVASVSLSQPHPVPKPDIALEQPIPFSAAGRQFTFTGSQVLATARRALADGLPPESQEYVSWAVEIDGHLVGVKWLFSLVTGAPRFNFTTFEAAPIFRRMGLSVQQLRTGSETEADAVENSRTREARVSGTRSCESGGSHLQPGV